MKQTILTIAFLMLSLFSFSQTNFKWEKTDSVQKTKSQLYSDTKMFIAETWKSAQDVIQNDDKEAGMILVKGLSLQSKFYQMNDHRWVFSYTVKFMMKDNKYKIIIEDVYCKSAICGQYEWAHMPVADTYPSEKGLRVTGVNETRYLELMESLKNELQSIADSYQKHVSKQSSVSDSNW